MERLRVNGLPRAAGLLSVALLGLVVAGTVIGQARPWGASAQATAQLAIDADADNGSGPCNPVDAERSVSPGSTYRVAVCLLNQPEAPRAFDITILYDGTINSVPEVADAAPALDDNPDANAGATVFSSPDLGSGWDCTGITVLPPKGDDPITPEADARIVCNASITDPVATLTQSGPLAVITFNATAAGDEVLSLGPTTAVGGAVGVIGRCASPDPVIPCTGATIHKLGAGQPTLTPRPGGPTPTPTSTVAAPGPAEPLPGPREAVPLTAGCNLKAFMPYYAVGTQLASVAVDIAGGSPRLWFLVQGTTAFELFDPRSLERSTKIALGPTDEAGFICVDTDATWNRLVGPT